MLKRTYGLRLPSTLPAHPAHTAQCFRLLKISRLGRRSHAVVTRGIGVRRVTLNLSKNN
jgi:hypothetical protein